MEQIEENQVINNEASPVEEAPRPIRLSREDLPPDFAMGGQAVLEGVMMRGPDVYSVAVRKPQGDIVLTTHRFWPVVQRKRWLRFPVVRGAVSLIEMLLLGYKALDYSANVAEQAGREQEAESKGEQEPQHEASPSAEAPEAHRSAQFAAERVVSDPFPATQGTTEAPAGGSNRTEDSTAERSISPWAMAGVFVVSMALAMGLFVALPNVATHLIGLALNWANIASGFKEVNHPLAYNLVAGVVRAFVIVGYIWGISFLPDIRRLFQYHGAEHKVVMTFEKDEPLDVEHIRGNTTVHPRCGTTFIAIVLLVSIVIFAVLASIMVMAYPPFAEWSVWLRKTILIMLHILFMPLVAGVAYEITRRAGRHPDRRLYRVLLWPGMAFQRITTREPDESMIEVALAAFEEALHTYEHEHAAKRNAAAAS